MQSIGVKRVYTGYVYMGDIPSAVDSYGGYITNASEGSGSSYRYISLTHPAIPFNYISNARMYANRASTTDNDPECHAIWTYHVSTTETYIMFEYSSAGDAGRV